MRFLALGMLLGMFVLCGIVATSARQVDLQTEAATYITNQLDQPASLDDSPQRFVVRQGESATLIAERLEAEGLIQSAWSVRLISRFHGTGGDLKTGEYELRPNMRPTEIMAVIREGRYGGKILTIPEGWRAVEIADAIESQEIGRRAEFLELIQMGQFDHDFLASRPANASLEGYLFPDTYRAPM
ncbi:MAG TPA: endolytic transglycosylase MltG, partial [Chloroflexota bacterium]|nr:endolytic transglycosylase MltG [Chloroflexota bacterium]